MGNIVFVIYRPARQVLAAGMRTVVTGGGGTGAVDSVNGQTGVVVLTATDVGADTAGTGASQAASAVSTHVAASDPHPQYLTPAEGDARYERNLTAGANITIDRTNPAAPVISASGAGGGGGAVDSVNGQTGVVVLDAADVGADVAGAATAAVAAHTAAPDPHPQYLTPAEASSAYAPLAHVGAGGAAHSNAVAAGAAGFMTGADKTKLDGIATGATQNSSDAFLLTRGNHTGTQLASTISDFASAARAQTEAELVAGTNVTITPSGSGATRQLTIAAAGGGGSTNLTTTTSATTLTVNSDTGTDAVLPAATGAVAGVLTGADKTKLDGIAAGAQVNVPTDLSLGAITATTIPLNSSTGTDVTLPVATTSLAGLQSAADKTKLDGLSPGGTSLPVVRAIAGNETLALSNINTFGVNATTSNYTSTIPAQATVAWTADAELHFLPSNTGDITITAAAGVSLNGVVAGSAVLSTQNGAASIKRLAADSWWIGGIVDGGAGGAVDSVNGQTGVVVLDADDIAEGVTNHYYPQADETKLAGISAGATANSADAFLLSRGNHTGTQTSSTISDFASSSRAQTEAELVAGTNITITPSGTGATRQLTIASTGGGGGSSLASFRGKLMNADFRVNQRGYVSGTVVGFANTYTLDRWRVVTAGESLSFSASGNGYQITAPAGGVEQVIEGVNIEGGTYVLGWTGTATATVNGTARTSGETFTLTANTDVTVRFTGGTVSLAQLEPGSSVTAFEHRPFGLELALCQRYYWRGLPSGGHIFGSYANGAFGSIPVSLPVTMRSAPTLASNFTGISYTSCGSANIDLPTPNGFRFRVTSTAIALNASVTFAAGNYMEAIAEL